ncbi:MAG: hypothetical protein ACYDC6_02380 [Acidobacteriaceae bacterium]
MCFHWQMGARGVWVGLCLALVLLATALLMVWRSQSGKMLHAPREAIGLI